MRRRTVLAMALGGPALAALGVRARAASPSPAEQALAAFDPLVGKVWRGVSIASADVIDVLRFDRVAEGQAVRSVHSVNGGAYAGETLITWDAGKAMLVLFYATSGGFYTTGTVTVRGPGAFDFDQVVHGLDAIAGVRSTTAFADGVYSVRNRHLRDGVWVDAGGFDYREAPGG